METYTILFELSLILVFTKGFGLLTRKLSLPQVVGALLGGILLGPAVLGWVELSPVLEVVSELGVILLMFSAGLETNVKSIMKNGKSAIIVALSGVVVPVIAGILLGQSFAIGDQGFIQSIFIGIILADTAVAITIETLREMGKLNTKVGDILLGAAVIDDFVGIILLTVVSGIKGGAAKSQGQELWVIGKILLFLVFGWIVWKLLSKWLNKWCSETENGLKRYAVLALALCLMLSFAAEYYFEVPNVIGAFLAGLIFSDNSKKIYIMERSDTISFMFFGPVFFAAMGLKTDLAAMDADAVWFAVILTVVAIVTKMVGCGIGAKLTGFRNRESFQIACGMVSPGEFALVIASKGIAMGVASTALLPPIIIMVIVTTVIAPILLKYSFRNHL